MIFLLFLAIKLGKLIRAKQSKGFIIGWLCFFGSGLLGTGLLGGDSLGLYFSGKGGVRRVVTFRATNIQVSDYDTKS